MDRQSSKRPKKKGRVSSRRAATAFRIALGVNIASLALLWLCCAGQWISPAHFAPLALGGLAFPFALATTGFALLLTLLLAPRLVWLPVVGLLSCFGSLRTYYPLNFPSPAPRDCVGVLTYNVHGFFSYNGNNADIANYIAESGADIAVLQEAHISAAARAAGTLAPLERHYPHSDTLFVGSNVLMVASAYPIVGKRLLFRHGSNGAGLFLLKISERDTLWLVNAHLESMHLSNEELTAYSTMVHSLHEGRNLRLEEQSSLDIVRKIMAAGRERAAQADSLAAFLAENRGRNLMLCGDFNDAPVSYAHRAVARYLDDAHTQAGRSIGRSYNRNAIFVRIDQMFYAPEYWKPYGCRVESRPDLSDHNPMMCRFKRRSGV